MEEDAQKGKRSYNLFDPESITVYDDNGTEVPLEFVNIYNQNCEQSFKITRESSMELTDMSSNVLTHDPLSPTGPSFQKTSLGSENDLSKQPPQSLKEFLEWSHFQLKRIETRDQRVNITNRCVEYLILRFTRYPTTAQKICVAKELIKLFPELRGSDTAEGYEAFVDPENHGSGYFANRLKTINRKWFKRPIQRKKREVKKKETTQVTEDFNRTKEELKAAVPNKELETIIEKTNAISGEIKNYCLTKVSINLKEEFPRFFDVKGLVNSCFENTFQCTNKFEDWWTEYNEFIPIVAKETLARPFDSIYEWPETVKDVLFMSFMFPTHEKQDGAAEYTYEQRIISSLIRFKKSDVPISEFLSKIESNLPFIVAEGLSKKEISNYIIVIDGEPLSDTETNFLPAFDLLIRSHFLFNVKYNGNLKQFFKFIDVYIYKISKKLSPTPKMRTFFSRILTLKEKKQQESSVELVEVF